MAISLSHFEHRNSQRARVMIGSTIREILEPTERGHLIFVAGGILSTAALPLAALRDAAIRTIHASGAGTFQYSTAEGIASPASITGNAKQGFRHTTCLPLSFATVSPQQIDLDIERFAAPINAHARPLTTVPDLDYV